MLNVPVKPQECTTEKKIRSIESISIERIQNKRLLELGIDPYEYDTEKEYTEEEQELINEAMKLIILNQEVPAELADQVRKITNKGSNNFSNTGI